MLRPCQHVFRSILGWANRQRSFYALSGQLRRVTFDPQHVQYFIPPDVSRLVNDASC